MRSGGFPGSLWMCSWYRLTNGTEAVTVQSSPGRYTARAVVMRFTVRTSSSGPGKAPTAASWVPTRGWFWSRYCWLRSKESAERSQSMPRSIGQWSEPQLATAAEGKSPRAAMNRVARQDMEILPRENEAEALRQKHPLNDYVRVWRLALGA